MCLAIPGKIKSIAGEPPLGRRARVDFGGVIKEASLACLPAARVGDHVIVHAGFALSLVDEAEARKIFEYLQAMDGLTELTEGGA